LVVVPPALAAVLDPPVKASIAPGTTSRVGSGIDVPPETLPALASIVAAAATVWALSVSGSGAIPNGS
jgi:hypothetical protein